MRLFASEGAKVLIADRNAERGPWVASDIGGEALYVETDVRNGEDVQGMFSAADEAWGRIDVIYNNAGVGPPEGGILECPEHTYDLVSDVNIRGVWLGMKYGIPHLERAGGGSIIATASVAGLVGLAGMAAYCASKGAVIAMVQAAAGEWASKNIRINCICPGGIATGQGWLSEERVERSRQDWAKMHPIGRSGEAIDIANAALFLASDASALDHRSETRRRRRLDRSRRPLQPDHGPGLGVGLDADQRVTRSGVSLSRGRSSSAIDRYCEYLARKAPITSSASSAGHSVGQSTSAGPRNRIHQSRLQSSS